jgi:hypothetical protein
MIIEFQINFMMIKTTIKTKFYLNLNILAIRNKSKHQISNELKTSLSFQIFTIIFS